MDVDAFGVETPEAGAEIVVPRVLVVPLLGFDARLHRLGYGAGHYDRTLAALRESGEARAIGFAYAAQEVAELPVLPTDIALDAVVTEEGVRRR
jgi:5-formyltetrahydrofolate cyclo-ligase